MDGCKKKIVMVGDCKELDGDCYMLKKVVGEVDYYRHSEIDVDCNTEEHNY